jgi:hypothetical protein
MMSSKPKPNGDGFDVRRTSLSLPLPPLSIISEKNLFPGVQSRQRLERTLREALKDASGDWVLPYVFRALGDEDRSQRCQLALAREIAAQEPSIDSWFERLLEEPGLCDVSRAPIWRPGRRLNLLDEILAVRLTIMDEPELYDASCTSRWAPQPFPDM